MINSPHDPINPYYDENGPKQKGLTVFEFASLEIYKELVKSVDLMPYFIFENGVRSERNYDKRCNEFAEHSMYLASIWIDRIMQGYREENPDLYTPAEEVKDANS